MAKDESKSKPRKREVAEVEPEVLATKRGTEKFKKRFAKKLDQSHFRLRERLHFPSIGFGTYLGEPDDKTDTLYEKALEKAIKSGCNFFDTAINYRCMRSERVIGRVLKKIIEKKPAAREEFIIATKGGFIPYDGKVPDNPIRYIKRRFIDRHVLIPEDIVAGGHCMTADFLEDQLEQSLRNLQLECVDIYFIHNPEVQLEHIPRKYFYAQLHDAFKMLERKVDEGKIHYYGLATWNGLVVYPDDKQHLPLSGVVELARMAGGENHHFRFVQAPFNFKLLDAYTSHNQIVDKTQLGLLDAARCCDVAVIGSSPLLQGRLTENLPEAVKKFVQGLETDAQRSLQFVRSAPGMLSALVGMKSTKHVAENLGLAALATMSEDEFSKMFE